MIERFAQPVISIIVEHKALPGFILLQKRSKFGPPGLSGLFELPQGRLRQGESLISCAKRELLEETGLVGFHAHQEMAIDKVLEETLESTRCVTVVEVGQHSYLGICIIGSAEGIPRGSAESSDPSWYSREEVLQMISLHNIFPLNVPMLLAYYGQKEAL